MNLQSPFTSALVCLLVGSVCSAADDSVPSQQASESELRQQPGEELVEIVIRLPDGRVIRRKEARIASRIDSDTRIFIEDRPPIVNSDEANSSTKGVVDSLKNGVSGGSNSGLSGGGGGAAGGSSSSSTGGGGGGGSGFSGGNGDGSLGDQTDTGSGVYDNSLLTDTDRTIWIYAWQDTGGPFTDLTFNIFVNPRNKTPEHLARLVAEEVENTSPERVVLRLKDEFIPADRFPFDPSNPVEMLQAGGYKGGLVEYWNAFAMNLASLGVEPDMVVLDQEHGIEFDRLPSDQREEFFQALIESPSPVTSDAPLLMREMDYEQFRYYRGAEAQAARDEYHHFAIKFRSMLLREVFLEAFDQAYGKHIPISNYNESNISFPVYQYRGMPIPNVTMGSISSPICYLLEMPTWGRYSNTSKDIRWNRLIDNLNVCRSGAAVGPVMPWISAPGFGVEGQRTWASESDLPQEMEFWTVQMQHLVAMGVDNYMIWNPAAAYNPTAVLGDQLVDEWLRNNPVAPTQLVTDLPEIPLDADQIVTNGVVTTYEQFLEIFAE